MRLFFKPTLLIAATFPLLLLTSAAFAHGMSDADKQAIVEGGNLIYMWLGATHMLTGYDHLAFVFGIIFFLQSFRDIVKYVSAFTIGHSVTLIIATFNGVQLNYYLIDAIVGLSVAYIAFANLDGFRKVLKVSPPNMMVMIVGLGLIHGFGLSTRLQELPLSADHLLLNIISFNVGIELGQVAALAFMLALIAVWRKRASFQPFSLIANYTLIAAGALLFLLQLHDFAHAAPHLDGDVIEVAVSEDALIVVVPANKGIEYKVLMNEGADLEYAWESRGADLYFDFHGEPKGDTTGYFQSYLEGTKPSDAGALTAPFEGTHGWYWRNVTPESIKVSLKISGNYELINPKK